MPIHDWKRADVGLFHHFHQSWASSLADAFNGGVLPDGFYALIERQAGTDPWPAPPHDESDGATYARRANRVGVRNKLGELIAAVEIVSPGNKDRTHALQAIVNKTLDFLAKGIHVLVIDLFPPTARDPLGIHRAIWDEVRDDDYAPPADQPLTLASYVSAPAYTAYVEAAAVGGPLPAMPLFLEGATYVLAPLEETYARTWEKCPREMRAAVEGGDAGG